MIIEIKYVSEHGSIVQLVGKFKDSGKVAAIGFDRRMFAAFVEANPDLTFPFLVDYEDGPEPSVQIIENIH
jgi:hypothetical protein